MRKFLTDLIVSVFTNDEVQKTIKNLLGQLITERILPLVPVAVGAAVKAAMDELIERVPGVEGVVDAVDVAAAARHALNDILPDWDTGIGPLDAIMDAWRPKE